MNDLVNGPLIPVVFFLTIPIVFILTKHQQKMASLMRDANPQANDLAPLINEIRSLHHTVNALAITVDELKSEVRSSHLESRINS